MIILYYNTIILVLFFAISYMCVVVCTWVLVLRRPEASDPLRAGVKGVNELLNIAARN